MGRTSRVRWWLAALVAALCTTAGSPRHVTSPGWLSRSRLPTPEGRWCSTGRRAVAAKRTDVGAIEGKNFADVLFSVWIGRAGRHRAQADVARGTLNCVQRIRQCAARIDRGPEQRRPGGRG